MLTQIPLSPSLARILDEVCSFNAPSCKHGACVHAFDESLESLGCQLLTLEGRTKSGEYRDLECNHCLLVLALSAIEEHVEAGEIDTWLATPNLDMRGRTPQTCLRDGNYDFIFKALWMRDSSPATTG